MLQRAHRRHTIDMNCVDSLGRGALTLAIEGENLEMVELLVVMGVETRDALLHAINSEFVEAVELLLEHEEIIHKDGEPYVSAGRKAKLIHLPGRVRVGPKRRTMYIMCKVHDYLSANFLG